MKTIGILQPGRIGDIIINLPIAKHYSDLGYNVVWPIAAPFIKSFTYAADYVQFIPVKHDNAADIMNWHRDAEWILNQFDCEKVLDLLYDFPGSSITSTLWHQSKQNFDEYRYTSSDVPFEKKWNLKINRNIDREMELYTTLVKQEKYVVTHLTSSAGRKQITLSDDILNDYQVIDITPVTNNVFDWCTILEKAAKLIMVDSCFVNLVEGLNLNDNKVLIPKGGTYQMPIVRTKWKVVNA